MDHDTGFAPHPDIELCFLTGCKKTTVEKWARDGSWVIGIGGKNTYKPDKIIYAMKVKHALTFKDFKTKYPSKRLYYRGRKPGPNILVSEHFVYFGDKAIDIPNGLTTMFIKTQGCKCVSDEDARKLEQHFNKKNTWGKIGNPNNPSESKSHKTNCGCHS